MNNLYAPAAQRLRYAAAGDLTSAQLQTLYDNETADNIVIAAGSPTADQQMADPTLLARFVLALARKNQRNDPSSGYAAFKAAANAPPPPNPTVTVSGGGSGGSGRTSTTTRSTTSNTSNTSGTSITTTPVSVTPASTSMLDNPYVKYGAIGLAVAAGATVIGLAIKKARKHKKNKAAGHRR